uniref:PIN domain-containing protein n=1 Tax=Timema genevievae TaxID=629358 RepID=A0A7R9PNV6_TIMGE|nr:unnamed protein product [Timema genevievae]
MHHMGQLWLRAEVRDLESRVRRRGAAFSPYLAVDGDALIYHIHLVKQLVGARKFIVLIPSVVVSALDKLKREVSRAREAIRWLESQFQRGNRFLRAQRNHEQLPLPLIKYPKKKDREAWLFFQVLECCHYFSQQTGVHEIQPDISVVTLLTGHKDEHNKMDFSPVGVAKSAGKIQVSTWSSLKASTPSGRRQVRAMAEKGCHHEPPLGGQSLKHTMISVLEEHGKWRFSVQGLVEGCRRWANEPKPDGCTDSWVEYLKVVHIIDINKLSDTCHA